jgi:hypothetical protein
VEDVPGEAMGLFPRWRLFQKAVWGSAWIVLTDRIAVLQRAAPDPLPLPLNSWGWLITIHRLLPPWNLWDWLEERGDAIFHMAE